MSGLRCGTLSHKSGARQTLGIQKYCFHLDSEKLFSFVLKKTIFIPFAFALRMAIIILSQYQLVCIFSHFLAPRTY